MSGFEDLLLVLLSEVDQLIDCVFLHDNPLHRVLVLAYYRATFIVLGSGPHQVRHLGQRVFCDVLHLQRRQAALVLLR